MATAHTAETLQPIFEDNNTLKLLKVGKIKSTILIQYLSLAYSALYLLFIISENFGGSYPNLTAEGIGVYSLFILFIIGLSISWFNKLITGIIFFAWNFGMWFLERVIVADDYGFGIVTGFPLIVLGAFFILKGIEEKRETPISLFEKWKIVLLSLSVIYSLIYIIVIITDATSYIKIDLYTSEGIISLILILMFFFGFIFSMKKELIAGILFILWYAGIVYLASTSTYDFFKFGLLAGLAVLTQGILYIILHLKIKKHL